MKEYLTNEVKKLEVEIGKRLFAISKMNKIKHPPSPLQAKIIRYLLENKDKKIYQKDIENELGISKATISEALHTMEIDGIIEKVIPQNDARAKQIILTEKSKERFNEMKRNFAKLDEELIKGISEEEVKKFLVTLDKMVNNIKAVNI